MSQEAFVTERDRRRVEGLEEELRRLHERDRQRRQGNGAAGANLAAMRQKVEWDISTRDGTTLA